MMADQNEDFCMLRYFKVLMILIHIVWDFIKWIFLRSTTKSIDTYSCLVGKTAIVTGGSTGLGYAACTMLASRGCRVIIATNVECESEKNKLIETTKNPNIIAKYIDLGNLDSVRKFAQEINETETKIDFLLNNAGVAQMKDYVSVDKLNIVTQVHYLGHFLLTHLLIDKLKAASSARVVFVASALSYFNRMAVHKLKQLPEKSAELVSHLELLDYYANAKFCSMIAAKEMGRRLRENGIIVNTVDPGAIRTNIIQKVYEKMSIYTWLLLFIVMMFRTDPYTAVKNTIYTLTGEDVKTGKHYFQCNPIHEPYNMNNSELCKKIWEQSEEIVRLKPQEKM